MFFFCPCCGNRAVALDLRCRQFVCLTDSCHQAFPFPSAEGRCEDEIVRDLNAGVFHPTTIQEWIAAHSDCTGQPVQPSADVLSRFNEQFERLAVGCP